MIDGGVWLGHDPTREGGDDHAHPLAALARFGVTATLATSFKSAYFDVREGNSELLAHAAASGGRVIPLPLINPLAYDPTGSYLDELKALGAKAIFMCPQVHFDAWGWSNPIIGAIAQRANRLGLAIQVGLRNAGELGDVARSILPEGPRVLVRWLKGSGYNLSADMLAVGASFSNAMFDIGTTTQSGAIEYLAARLGADRLFVASNYPLGLAAPAYYLVRAARLSATDRAAILGGTLAAIFGGCDDEGRADDPWEDLLARPKIDTHWHSSGWNLIEPRVSTAAMREDFDAFSYRYVVSSSVRALNDDLAAGNAETAAFCDADSRVRGWVVVNPLQHAASLAQLDRYGADPRFVGVKTIQDFYSLDLDDARYAPILDRAEAMGLPVMAHMGGMARVAAARPNLTLVAAHSSWRFRDFRDLPNVYCDIATSSALAAHVDIAELVETVGEDRVLFSCDGQLISPAWTIGKIASAGLPETTLNKILLGNALAALPRLSLEKPHES